MHLAGGREFSVDGLYMKHCGSEIDPALLVSPDGEMQGDALNGIRFYGLVSSYPRDRNVVLETDTSVKSNQTRQIDFFGAQLHENEPADEGSGGYPEGHGAGRNVEIRGVRGVRFWGCNLRNSKPDTAVVTFSQAPSGEFNGGIRFVGCSFSASQSGVAGVVFRYLRGDDPPVLIGNGFGTYAPLDHAVDWAGGDKYDVYASGNVFEPTKHPFRGHVPHNRERPGIGATDELHTGYYDDWADGKATRRSRTSVQLQTAHRPKVVPARYEWIGGEVGEGYLSVPARGQADVDAWMSTAYGGWELTGSFDATPGSGHLQWNVMQGSPSNGYALRLGAEGQLALVKRVEDEATTLIEGSWPADDAEHTILLTREHAGNEFVLRFDGAMVGTAEDEWTPLPAKRGFVGFRNRSNQRFRATELAVGTAQRSRSRPRPIPKRSVSIGGGLDDRNGVSPVSFSAGPSVGEVSTGGQAWLSWDDDALYLSARIEDDTHHQPHTGGAVWKGDSIQFGVGRGRPGTYERFDEFAVALTPDGEQVFLYEQPGGEAAGLLSSPDVAIERDDGAGVTTYEVAFPWSVLPVSADADVGSLSLVVNDNDGQGRTGWAQWGGGIAAGKDTNQFQAVQFTDDTG
jgi:hypothetical protein